MTRHNYTEEEKDELYSRIYSIPVKLFPSIDGKKYDAWVPFCLLSTTEDDRKKALDTVANQIPTYLARTIETGFEVPNFSHFFKEDDVNPVLIQIDLDTRISVSAAVETRRRCNKDFSLNYEETLLQILAEKRDFYRPDDTRAKDNSSAMGLPAESNQSACAQKTLGSYPTNRVMVTNGK